MKEESEYTKLVRELLKGKKIQEITLRGKRYVFSEKQSEFISSMKVGENGENKFMLFSGGRGCGKSLAMCIKIYLVCKGFKGIQVLLGRKNISDIEKTTLQDLFRIMPPHEYEYRVKDGIIRFKNGSQIILFGLDAMQSGSAADMKKANQKTKSLNIGSYFIDQLEEIEYDVFQSLGDTMRMTSPELDYPRQGNMTTNPANFWGYHYFKLGERMNEDGHWVPKVTPDSTLIEGSMLDNKDNLPVDFVRDRLSREESYVRRMVHGEWTLDLLLKGAVFANEHIKALELIRKAPLRKQEGCEIYEEPRAIEYRMGVDPSEGVVDPSSISVVDIHGRKVAKWNGMIPIQGLADKVKFLYYLYNKPLIVVESNTGAALIREIRDLKLYRRKRTDEKYDIETEKLGFRMSWESKQQLISHFQSLLRRGIPKIFDARTTQEMRSFMWSDEATQSGAGASRGFHDDDVISTMLAYWDWTPLKTEAALIAQSKPVHVKKFNYY